MPLKIKPKDQCRWDELSLGEVMLRFDPGDHRRWRIQRRSWIETLLLPGYCACNGPG